MTQLAEAPTSRGYIKKATDYLWSLTGKMTETLKRAPADDQIKELSTVVTNQKCLLEWFRQEEKGYIDLLEIREISSKYINPGQAAPKHSYPSFESDPHSIAKLDFVALINHLQIGITLYELVVKRYESLLEAYLIYDAKKEEYMKERGQTETEDEPRKAKRKQMLQYLDNTKQNLAKEKDEIALSCKKDTEIVLASLKTIFERLNNSIMNM